MVRIQHIAQHNAPVVNFGAKTAVQAFFACFLDQILQPPLNFVRKDFFSRTRLQLLESSGNDYHAAHAYLAYGLRYFDPHAVFIRLNRRGGRGRRNRKRARTSVY